VSARPPHALAARPAAARPPAALDTTLPVVPFGAEHLQGGGQVLVLHAWAPWQRHATADAVALDSLATLEREHGVRVLLVTFEPYMSVARWARRHRLRVPLLLDHERTLARQLTCPALPCTWVIDRQGRVAAVDPGEIDWLGAATRATLAGLAEENAERPPPAARPAS
jgi:AhpC/TSA family protein